MGAERKCLFGEIGGKVRISSNKSSTTRGDTWIEASQDLSTNDASKMPTGKGGDGAIEYCTITALDESPIARGLIWVGTDDGNVWVAKNVEDMKAWTKLNDSIPGNPGYWVSQIVVSAGNKTLIKKTRLLEDAWFDKLF